MEKRIELFQKLSKTFKEHGYSLYMVGGTVRDYLLGIPLSDMDLVTDATPEETKVFIRDADYTFAKYGSIKLILDGVKFDITTLRKESNYSDSRHPSKVEFTKDLKEDVLRRDITINAMYLDSALNLIDLVGGKNDLDNHIIKMVGDPTKKIQEDPLRIVRIFRFSLEYDFTIEPQLRKILENNMNLLSLLNKDKVNQEIRKSTHQDELKKLIKLIDL